MNNNSEDISKMSLLQFFSKVNLYHIIAFIGGWIGILIFVHEIAYKKGYDNGLAIASKNSIITKKPEFELINYGTYKDENEDLFIADCAIQNNGDINATEIYGEIKSNVELSIEGRIGKLPLEDSTYWNGKISNGDRKTYKFYCKILPSKDIILIELKSKERPTELKLVKITCNECQDD